MRTNLTLAHQKPMGAESKAISSEEQKRLFRMLLKYLKPYSWWVLLLVMVYVAFTFLTALEPLILAPILDMAIRGGEIAPVVGTANGTIDLNNIGQLVLSNLGLSHLSNVQIVIVLAMAYLVAAASAGALNFANYLIALKIKTGAGRDMQVDLFRHLFSLSLDFFNRERIGELVARLDQDTKNAVAGFETILRNLLVSPLLVLYYGYLLVITNVTLTLFVVTAALVNYLLTRILRRPIQKRIVAMINVDAGITSYLQEKLSSTRVVKTFVAEKYEASHLRKLVQEVRRVNMRFGILKHADEPVTTAINALVNVSILIFSVNELFSGRLSTTGFLLYLFIGRSILSPLTSLVQSYNSLQSTLAMGVRVRELFDIQPSVVSGGMTVPNFADSISFKNVSFRYADTPVVENLNFEIRKGAITALVGPSGGGKSTIADLLMRFYDCDSGQILFEGQDIRGFDVEQYRRIFGVVAQESVLFNATIAENIAYARPELTTVDIEHAARIANANEFIMEMPEGYETYVGDRGVRLSGGQRQRIAIARAIVHRPQILILDEATSSLDTESEKRVQQAVDQAIRSTTALVIAHRLSTVMNADEIIVLERGRILDKGTHGELLQRCELYRRLASLQFGSENIEKKEVA